MYGTRSGLNNYIGWPICGGPQQIQQTRQFVGLSGVGDCGCGCGGRCRKGLGAIDTVVNVTPSGSTIAPAGWYQSLFPSGAAFASGFDISGWGFGEWAIIGAGVYILISVVTTTQRVGRRAARAAGAPVRGYRKFRRVVKGSKKRRAEELRRQARELEGDTK